MYLYILELSPINSSLSMKLKTVQTKSYNFRLHKTQDLLYESTKDFLELRYQGRANERQWMAEKDRLLRELDSAKDKFNGTKDSLLNMSTATEVRSHYAEEVKVKIVFT